MSIRMGKVVFLDEGLAEAMSGGAIVFGDLKSRFLASPAAWSYVKTVSACEDAIRQAVRGDEPSVTTRYLPELAKDFNRFYNEGKMIGRCKEET